MWDVGKCTNCDYLRFQSAGLMLAFLSFAIASLGIFANVKPSTDFGIIQFLVTSSIQCAAILFGLLHVYTWLVFLVGCALMVLKWKMASGHFAEPKGWGGKLWQMASANLIAFRRKVLFLEYSARGEIYESVWNWKWWHNIGNSTNQSTISFYIHFREILHRFMLHMCHHTNYDRNGGRTPPV